MTDKRFTRRAALGAGLSLLGGAAIARPAAAATSVRVMTWNIHGESVSLSGVASVIEAHDVDIFTLQEIHRREDQDQVAILADSLGLELSTNVHFGPADLVGPCDKPWPSPRAGQAGNAIFTRYPIVKRVTKHLSPEDQDCPVKRAMSGVRLAIGGRTTHVFSTHLTPGTSAAAVELRHEQTSIVADYLTHSGPLLLTGDFNDHPDSWVHKRITDKGFVDAGGRFGGEPTHGDARIDFIFYRGCSVTGGFVVDTDYSDHRPVVMDVSV